MPFLKSFERWLDIRPREIRKVTFCISGAFLLLAFVVLARSMREGLFLDIFDVKNLPPVTAAIACLSLPAVGLFAGLLGRYRPWPVLKWTTILFCIGLGVIWAASQHVKITAVAFYIWTSIGGMLLTSGFWVLVAECFAIRGAKRLFGLIAAGGTAGAMVMGLSTNWITERLHLLQIVPLLIGTALLLYLVECRIYHLSHAEGTSEGKSSRTLDDESNNKGRSASTVLWNLPGNFKAILKSPYLGSIAAIVFIATFASTIVDYQFKEFAEMNYGSGERLAGFFGSFYGWSGGIALAIQLIFTARIMGSTGITPGLAVLPGMLLLGSTGFLALPGLYVATLVRGGDYTLRQSLLRPMLEFLYVPIPARIRRKTKTFIDSFVNSIAEGAGAFVFYLWVTLAGGQSRYLSVPVILLSLTMLLFSRYMGKQYLGVIVTRLKEGDALTPQSGKKTGLRMDLLTASFSRIDVQSMFMDRAATHRMRLETPPGVFERGKSPQKNTKLKGVPADSPDIASILQSSDDSRILQVLPDIKEWDPERIFSLTRLLTRDALQETVMESLVRAGYSAVPCLAKLLLDDDADFVVRRRIPRILACIGGQEAEMALLGAISSGRFEIRYRAVTALVGLQKRGLFVPRKRLEEIIWGAIRNEVRCSRPVWEMRRLLDSVEPNEVDELVAKRVDTRSSLSLEHTFRMLTFVHDPEPVMAAFHGILAGNEDFKSFALEYLERTLPGDIREKLWLFIGDVSEARKEKETRPLKQVVSDLMSSKATIFKNKTDRDALRRILKNKDDGSING